MAHGKSYAGSQLPITYYLLPITCYLLPFTFHLLPLSFHLFLPCRAPAGMTRQ